MFFKINHRYHWTAHGTDSGQMGSGVTTLGRYQTNPGLDHWKAAKKVLRYLQGTKDYKLAYRRSEHLEVVGYSDSDFAKCKDVKKSTSGYIFMLVGGPISWKSHKQ
ncbi:putative RNA-directed DNA polymerase [Helianthus annuus]|nr:putative RNA-directed DNA polymerase [Helianthus annuus]